MNPRIEKFKKICQELRDLFPECLNIHVAVNPSSEDVSLHLPHEESTYANAVALMRDLGVKDRSKRVYDNYTSLRGASEGVEVTTFPNELPPTCRRVTITEKVPKTQTVDTGEFVEITRTVIQCGEEKEVA